VYQIELPKLKPL